MPAVFSWDHRLPDVPPQQSRVFSEFQTVTVQTRGAPGLSTPAHSLSQISKIMKKIIRKKEGIPRYRNPVCSPNYSYHGSPAGCQIAINIHS